MSSDKPKTQSAASIERYNAARKVTIIGAVIDLLLGGTKVVVGFIAQSHALIADGIHSFSDLATDVMVLLAAKQASRDADEEHPYGHARIETLATVLLGTTLIVIALGIAWDATLRLMNPETLQQPTAAALVVALISVFAKEAVYRYTIRAARRLRSNLLAANAWHSRTDAISSVIVVIGVAGAMQGIIYFDAVAAIGVAIMIAHIGWGLGWNSLQELIDRGLEAERVDEIRETILLMPGVEALHMLRTRSMGADALVDVHIMVEPRLTVSEGHHISESVRAALMKDFEEITDVMVHIDPEDDEINPPCCNLPGREIMREQLLAAWAGTVVAAEISEIRFHYLAGAVQVEAVLPLARAAEKEDLQQQLATAARQVSGVSGVRLYFG